jgi:hypothetical protein
VSSLKSTHALQKLPPVCPLCKKGYKPDAKSLGLQLYCPNEGCQHWIHVRCLQNKNHPLRVARDDPPSYLLRAANIKDPEGFTSPASSEDGAYRLSPCFRYACEYVPLAERVIEKTNGRHFKLLLAFAGGHIIRGGDYGVAGNVKDMHVARHIVVEILRGMISPPPLKKLSEQLGEEAMKTIEQLKRKDNIGLPSIGGEFACPKCQRAI